MQKKIIMLSLLLLLAGCNNVSNSLSNNESTNGNLNSSPANSSTPSSSSTSTSSNPSSGNSSTSSQTVSKRQQIINTLNQLIDSDSYAVMVDDDIDIFTKDYIVKNSSQEGYVKLKALNSKSNQQIYKFDIVDNVVNLKHAVIEYSENTKKIVDSMDDLAPFSLLSKSTITSAMIEQNTDGYFTSNQNIIMCLAKVLGYEDYADQVDFPSARLEIEDGNLKFTLQTTPDYMVLEDFASGTFVDINNASSPLLEQYIQDFSFKYFLSDEMIAPLTNDGVSFSSKIETHYYGESDFDIIGTSLVDVSSKCLSVEINDFGDSSTSSLYLVPEDEMASKVYVNGKNELSYEKTNTKWQDVAFPNKFFLANEFCLISSNTYRYFGNNPNELFDATTYVILNEIESIDITLNKNVASKITFTFKPSQDLMGASFYYRVSTSIEKYVAPSLPELAKANEDTPIIKESFDKLNGQTSFTIKSYDIRQTDIYTITKITNNAILKEEYSPKPGSLEEINVKRTGYALTNSNKVLPFVVSSNNEVRVTGAAIDKTIAELIGFDVAPELFINHKDEKYFSLGREIYDLDKHIFGGNNLSNYKYDTLVMNYDDEGFIRTIKYGYSINNGLITGTEQVEIYDYNNTTIEDEIVEQFATLADFALPQTWESETNVWDVLVEAFGEDVARLVPYLYDETLALKWSAFYTSTMFCINVEELGLKEDPTNYIERYIELLRNSNGFIEDIDAFGNTIFVYGDILQIKVGYSPNNGIYISVPK